MTKSLFRNDDLRIMNLIMNLVMKNKIRNYIIYMFKKGLMHLVYYQRIRIDILDQFIDEQL